MGVYKYIYIQVMYYIQTLSTALMARVSMAIRVDGDGVDGYNNNSNNNSNNNINYNFKIIINKNSNNNYYYSLNSVSHGIHVW